MSVVSMPNEITKQIFYGAQMADIYLLILQLESSWG